MKRPNSNKPARQIRRDEAAERAVRRQSLTAEEQLKILDARPGNSTRERERLMKKAEK